MNTKQNKFDFSDESTSFTPETFRKRRTTKLPAWIVRVGIVGIALGLLVPLLPAVASHENDAEYAVYLSPGRDTKIPWNGYHVSITGFSKANAPHEKNMKALAKAWREIFQKKSYHFSKPTEKGKEYKFRDPTPSDGWRVDFKSDLLDKLERFLEKNGFDRLGSTRHKPYWHISLYGKSEHDAKKKLSELAEQEWHLWLVRKHGEWTAIK